MQLRHKGLHRLFVRDQVLEGSVNNASVIRKFRSQLIALFIILVSLFSDLHLISAQSVFIVQVGPGTEFTVDANGYLTSFTSVRGNSVPLRTITPQYPARARQRGISGWNLVSFAVNEEGNVDEDSIVIINSAPPEIFDSSTIRAVVQFKFQPPTVNGARVGIQEIQYIFSYRFPETNQVNREYQPLNYITPEYPLTARKENIEGYVLVEFTVTNQGMPAGIVILDRSPSDIFNASAVNAAERFRFDPRVMDGQPVEAVGVQYLFNFKPGD